MKASVVIAWLSLGTMIGIGGTAAVEYVYINYWFSKHPLIHYIIEKELSK